jgi:flagellar basal-body rod protein FlgB
LAFPPIRQFRGYLLANCLSSQFCRCRLLSSGIPLPLCLRIAASLLIVNLNKRLVKQGFTVDFECWHRDCYNSTRRTKVAAGKARDKRERSVMAISFDNALGVHEQALKLRVRRAEVLSSNLANADTPGYKARDFDFQKALASQMSGNGGFSMKTTRSGHMGANSSAGTFEMQYRLPTQPSIDGNTVEEQVEQAEFTKNALDFQASFTFLNSRFTGLKKALKGE